MQLLLYGGLHPTASWQETFKYIWWFEKNFVNIIITAKSYMSKANEFNIATRSILVFKFDPFCINAQ